MTHTRSFSVSLRETSPGAWKRGARFVAGGLFVAWSGGCAYGEALDASPGSLSESLDASVRAGGGQGGVAGSGTSAGPGSSGAVGSGGAVLGGASAWGGMGGSTVIEATGGVPASGGMTGTGGTSATGGTSSGGAADALTGGAPSSGGAQTGTGGGVATGGSVGSGGAAGTLTGGAPSSGGAQTGTGGGVATGGSVGSGGAGSTCKDYPTNDACSRCICANCASQVQACYGSSDPQKNSGCAQIEACAEQNHCASSPCYCGSAALCLAPNGPCKSVIETVDGTTDPLTIYNDGMDTSTALGRANAIGLCSTSKCKSECQIP